MPDIVHVVGAGTIGEPLIGLPEDGRDAFGTDEVTFHKRTPLLEERAKIRDLVRRGAVLATGPDRRAEFEELGLAVGFGAQEAIECASVVIDCTPVGNPNKELICGADRDPGGARRPEVGGVLIHPSGRECNAVVTGGDALSTCIRRASSTGSM